MGIAEGLEGSNIGNIIGYIKFMGMNGQPWCASIVSWVMDKAFSGDIADHNKVLRGGPVATFWFNLSLLMLWLILHNQVI